MLTDWIYWLSQRHLDELFTVLGALLLLDGPRYALSRMALCLYDCLMQGWRGMKGNGPEPPFTFCPSVCVIISAYNEAERILAPLRSVWGTYPKLEMIVVDDGSTDETFAKAQTFARDHPGVLVLRMPERSCKSPAMNMALQYTKADIIVGLDADAELGAAAIWEIVQPLKDPSVGAVSASVLGRNPFTNLVTWLQAYEFLHSVMVGRILSARLGLLGIASGAFSAFRREILDEGFGWDEGSSLDLDLTLRIRKSGFEIAHAPYAECYTDMLPTWTGLVRQRRRWDRTITIRLQGRKHVDMAYFWSRNFRFRDFLVLAESWFFSLFCMYGIVAWAVWFCVRWPSDRWQILLTLYLCYLFFELIQILSVVYYSNHLGRDLLICAVFPLVLFYQLVLLIVRLVATTEEILWRQSFSDRLTPDRVRQATWHW